MIGGGTLCGTLGLVGKAFWPSGVVFGGVTAFDGGLLMISRGLGRGSKASAQADRRGPIRSPHLVPLGYPVLFCADAAIGEAARRNGKRAAANPSRRR